MGRGECDSKGQEEASVNLESKRRRGVFDGGLYLVVYPNPLLLPLLTVEDEASALRQRSKGKARNYV